jgi:arylsulfatase A-like enzyme
VDSRKDVTFAQAFQPAPLMHAFKATLIGLIFSVTLPCTARTEERPNIIVILADDLGRGDYSAFGTSDIRTPAIDTLGKEGITFQNFYANSCVCSPTRAALLTGCYPDRVGVPGVIRGEEPANSWGYLSAHATLLPQKLRSAGYHSAIIGKWHLGIHSPNTPTERGFDFFHGFLGDMMDDYWTHLRHGQNFMRRNAEQITPEGHATDLFTEWACEYVKERSSRSEPFFLYLAYNAPHGPVQPPQEWLEKVKTRQPGINETRAKLVALIEHMDSGIGRLMRTLEEQQLSKNTLVIFSSDNGGLLPEGANNGTWRSGKTHMYEGGLRVPAFARWPKRITPGTSTQHVAVSMDIFSTCCAAAGVSAGSDVDGVSFLPTLTGEPQPTPARNLYFTRREGGPYLGKTIEALIAGEWKLVADTPTSPVELFDLAKDPQEKQNLAAQEKLKLQELSKSLREHIQRGGSTPWQRK